MGERKVLNKYFPPDFDPTKIPRKNKFQINPNFVVRMMLPMSVRCTTCGEYMYKGKKFNSRKEDVIGDDYLGIKKYRFYIKCCVCNNEIAFKTDPKNQDYVCESGSFGGVPFCFLASRAETVRARFPTITPSTRPGAGATRNFESWRQQDEAEEKFEGERKEAAEANAMSALESKTLDSKIEMDILDALDEIKVCVPASFVYRGDGVARLRVVA